jgi:hypothetical protein
MTYNINLILLTSLIMDKIKIWFVFKEREIMKKNGVLKNVNYLWVRIILFVSAGEINLIQFL